jgi:hypothetical protein
LEFCVNYNYNVDEFTAKLLKEITEKAY